MTTMTNRQSRMTNQQFLILFLIVYAVAIAVSVIIMAGAGGFHQA